MEGVSVKKDENQVNHIKQTSPKMSDKDESGFGEDISACSLEDKPVSEKMESDIQFTLNQSGNNKMLDETLGDQSFSFGGMKKDDSGIYSDKSANTTNTKETSDGEWSESVSEGLEDTSVETKDSINNTEQEKMNEDSEVTAPRIKHNDAIKSKIEDNNVKTDGIESMEEDLDDKISAEIDSFNDKEKRSKNELKDCVNKGFTQVSHESEQTESDRQQKNSDKCDNIDETHDDEDFADFIRRTVKSRSNVRKLVDYDTDESDNGSSDTSPVVAKGHRRYRKRKPETDSDEDTHTNENNEKVSDEQNDGTPVLLRHSQLNGNSEQNNVENSDLSTDSSEESHHSPKTRHDSSSDNEPEDVPPDISEFGPPRHKWRALFDLRKREFGYSSGADSGYFRKQVQGSLQMVKRFELQFKMERHEGCVNALHFNRIGKVCIFFF